MDSCSNRSDTGKYVDALKDLSIKKDVIYLVRLVGEPMKYNLGMRPSC